MKKNIFGLLTLILAFTYISCEEDLVVFDNINGQEALQFIETSLNVTVPEEGISVTLPVSVTTVSTTDRNFTVSVDDTSTGAAVSYSLGGITIPAGSYEGTLSVDLNTTSLEDGISYALVINLVAPAGGAVFKEQATIKYNKEVVCNDLLLVVLTDAWPDETSWEFTDDSGAVVASGPDVAYAPNGSAASRGKRYEHNITLPDGCYTFTMFDQFSDGMFDGTYAGSYELTCSILTHATGGGSFGASDSTDFAINVDCQ